MLAHTLAVSQGQCGGVAEVFVPDDARTGQTTDCLKSKDIRASRKCTLNHRCQRIANFARERKCACPICVRNRRARGTTQGCNALIRSERMRARAQRQASRALRNFSLIMCAACVRHFTCIESGGAFDVCPRAIVKRFAKFFHFCNRAASGRALFVCRTLCIIMRILI